MLCHQVSILLNISSDPVNFTNSSIDSISWKKYVQLAISFPFIFAQ